MRNLVVIGVTLLAIGLWVLRQEPQEPVVPVEPVDVNTPEPSVMEDIHFVAYEAGGKQYSVSAASAQPSRWRLGFLQLALVPTLELHDAVIERVGPDGPERLEVPHATVEWPTKTIRDPSGRILVKADQSLH